MAKRRRKLLIPKGLLLSMLIGMVLVPAGLSVVVGIIALAMWSDAFDIVLGILVLCFAGMATGGGIVALVFVVKSARLAEMQADFVANVSHDFRTPLAGIRLVAETLEAGRGDDPERLEALTEMLGDEVRRLEDLVERVLAWRQLDRGSSPLRHSIEVEQLVKDAVDRTTLLPEASGADIAVDVDSDVRTIRGDRLMLSQALLNLLHNAVKFGGKSGPIDITAGNSRGGVSIVVRDRGPGIAPGDESHIFERFYRSRHPDRANDRGTGLGLDIVKGVAESHNGRVSAANRPEKGAEFTLWLPNG